MSETLSWVTFAVFGLVPLVSQLLAIVLYRTERLEQLKKWSTGLIRIFPLFVCFDLFAQNRQRVAVAYRWGYRLKKSGVTVETGLVPDSSEVSAFLESETFETPAVVESLASFFVNAIETTHEFDELELTLLSKARPPLPSTFTGWFRHDDFVRAPFDEKIVLTYGLDP